MFNKFIKNTFSLDNFLRLSFLFLFALVLFYGKALGEVFYFILAFILSIPGFWILFSKNIVLKTNLFISIVTFLLAIEVVDFLIPKFINNDTTRQEIEKVVRARANELHINYDNRTPFEVMDDYGRSNKELLFSSLHFRSYLLNKVVETANGPISPLGGIPKVKVVSCNENGPYVYPIHDRFGFNNQDSVWDQNQIQIALVGDSFTYGDCVPFEDTITGQLLRDFPHTLNVGYESNGPIMELASLREFVSDLKPQTVFWMFFENDIADLTSEFSDPILPKYFSSPTFTQDLKKNVDLWAPLLKKHFEEHRTESEIKEGMKPWTSTLYKIKMSMHVGNLIEQLLQKVAVPIIKAFEKPSKATAPNPELAQQKKSTIAETQEPMFLRFEQILQAAKNSLDPKHSKLVFVFLPGGARYIPAHDGSYNGVFHGLWLDHPKFKERVLLAAKNANLPVIDIDNVFLKDKDPARFYSMRLPRHFSSAGYQQVAATLQQWVLEHEKK